MAGEQGPDRKGPRSKKAQENEKEAIQHLKRAIASGQHWYLALLEAIGLWTLPEETYRGRTRRYLIAGEAFDWLLLAERLGEEVNGFIPEDEYHDLIRRGKPPLELTAEKVRKLIGEAKYRAYLNYFYGITVEEALLLAVKEEVLKERRGWGYNGEQGIEDEAFRRLYGDTRDALLERFRKERRYSRKRSLELSQLKEFTYWLFKHRFQYWDRARVASDTKKGLNKLRQLGIAKKP